MPCFCSALKARGKQGPLQRHASYCVSPDSLGYLLEPIGKLRAKKITLHSCCSARDAVQQSFDQTTSNVTKNTPATHQGKVYFDLHQISKRDRRRVGIAWWYLPDCIFHVHSRGDAGVSMFLAYFLNERTMLTKLSKSREDLVMFEDVEDQTRTDPQENQTGLSLTQS